MVNALMECWRVLRLGGQLLDIRPAGHDRIIEVIAPDQVIPTGLIDVSKGRDDLIASNDAIETVKARGLFEIESNRTFWFSNYWPSVSGARAYVEDRWSHFATIPEKTWRKTDELARSFGGQTVQIAVRLLVEMVSYRRATPDS